MIIHRYHSFTLVKMPFWKSNFKIIWQTLNAINDHRPYRLALVAVRRKAWSLANPSQPKRHVPKRDIL
jgi:hypothetical protein